MNLNADPKKLKPNEWSILKAKIIAKLPQTVYSN